MERNLLLLCQHRNQSKWTLSMSSLCKLVEVLFIYIVLSITLKRHYDTVLLLGFVRQRELP